MLAVLGSVQPPTCSRVLQLPKKVDFATALRELIPLAEHGNPNAQNLLSVMDDAVAAEQGSSPIAAELARNCRRFMARIMMVTSRRK